MSNWALVQRFKVAELPAMTPASRAALDHAEAWYAIGRVADSRGAHADTRRHFQRAIALHPSHPRIREALRRAQTSERRGDPGESQ